MILSERWSLCHGQRINYVIKCIIRWGGSLAYIYLFHYQCLIYNFSIVACIYFGHFFWLEEGMFWEKSVQYILMKFSIIFQNFFRFLLQQGDTVSKDWFGSDRTIDSYSQFFSISKPRASQGIDLNKRYLEDAMCREYTGGGRTSYPSCNSLFLTTLGTWNEIFSQFIR